MHAAFRSGTAKLLDSQDARHQGEEHLRPVRRALNQGPQGLPDHEVEGDLHALVVVRDENLKAVFLGDQACERKLQLQIYLPIRAQ